MKKILLTAAVFILMAARFCYADEITAEGLDDIYNYLATNISAVEGAELNTEIYQNTDVCYAELKTFNFDSGDIFELYNYSFTPNSRQGDKLTNGFSIPGSTVEIRYYDTASAKWNSVTDINNLPKATLFIDTDKFHVIVGVPSVYTAYEDSHTAVIYSSLEQPVTVRKSEDGLHYDIKYTLNSSGAYNGSIWVLKSERRLVAWENVNQTNIMSADLVSGSRFLWNGYYFTEPEQYIPYYGNGSLYRQPSSYTAVTFAHYGSFPGAYDLGFAFTYICMNNQNEKGYWATGPKVNWLYSDFGIGGKFYDTRFNTDFAKGLLYAYTRYRRSEFIDSLFKYMKFYYDFASNHHYETENGGWLVQDYGFDGEYKSTHSSLNHQVAEMNLLYEVYNETKYEGFKTLGDKLLLAVEDTCKQWIMSNNNLKYALYYTGTASTMVDYPTLTYNDLFTAKNILSEMFNTESDAINKLMESKLKWMKANNVTGYYQ
ncbi:MAG: hypothetical protein LUD77_10915 [Clostridiales bacterium]|nr:hypothetical protein [Clostridiales bacterium]